MMYRNAAHAEKITCLSIAFKLYLLLNCKVGAEQSLLPIFLRNNNVFTQENRAFKKC